MDEPPRAPVNRVYPFALVWAPIPIVSWIFPFIGHMGVCCSKGSVYDFQGPYTIGVDMFLFGKPSRLLNLDPQKVSAEISSHGLLQHAMGPIAPSQMDSSSAFDYVSSTPDPHTLWDIHLHRTAGLYRNMEYNIMGRNCHAFVTDFLNGLSMGSSEWSMVHLAVLMFFKGSFVEHRFEPIKVWMPFLCFVCFGLWFWGSIFIITYAMIMAALCIWFSIYSKYIQARIIC